MDLLTLGPTELSYAYDLLSRLAPIICHYANLYVYFDQNRIPYINPEYGDFSEKMNIMNEEIRRLNQVSDVSAEMKHHVKNLHKLTKIRNIIAHNNFTDQTEILFSTLEILLSVVSTFDLFPEFTDSLINSTFVSARYQNNPPNNYQGHLSINTLRFINLDQILYPDNSYVTYEDELYNPISGFINSLADFLINYSYLLERLYNTEVDPNNVFIGTIYDLHNLVNSNRRNDYLSHYVLYISDFPEGTTEQEIRQAYKNPPLFQDLDLDVEASGPPNNVFILYRERSLSVVIDLYNGVREIDPTVDPSEFSGRFFKNANRVEPRSNPEKGPFPPKEGQKGPTGGGKGPNRPNWERPPR